MKEIPKVVSDAGIFRKGDIYILCWFESSTLEPDPIDALFTISCEEDIMVGLQLIHHLCQDQLLDITSCEELSQRCFRLITRIRAKHREFDQVLWLHRLPTARERADQFTLTYS